MKWSNAVCVIVGSICMAAFFIVLTIEMQHSTRTALQQGLRQYQFQGWAK